MVAGVLRLSTYTLHVYSFKVYDTTYNFIPGKRQNFSTRGRVVILSWGSWGSWGDIWEFGYQIIFESLGSE